jgi:hypothetical protein
MANLKVKIPPTIEAPWNAPTGLSVELRNFGYVLRLFELEVIIN